MTEDYEFLKAQKERMEAESNDRLAMARRAFKRLQQEFAKNAAEIEAVLNDGTPPSPSSEQP